jgi:hypothetical protein
MRHRPVHEVTLTQPLTHLRKQIDWESRLALIKF